ncbi:MAG: DinB family protein [Chitinophagaceae bacterium]
MYKKTKGYILLTLLIVTGLASQVPKDTLTGKERRFILKHLKDSKNDLFTSVKGLTEAQLNYQPAADKWSVKQCILHLAVAESTLWSFAETALKKAPEKTKEIKITDSDILNMMADCAKKFRAPENFGPDKSKWLTTEESLKALKQQRNEIIKYVKTTTNDVRNHISKIDFGYIDVYQLMLVISAHNNRHVQEIEEIKSSGGFPK